MGSIKLINEVLISTPRFVLTPLTEKDATPRYCSWLNNSTDLRFITAAKTYHDQHALRQYISERLERDDVLFLGIYAHDQGVHIGNIKYEPINVSENFAIMGILIGESQWRGQGVAPEVIKYSTDWLYQNLGIKDILLGVEVENYAAIRAYEKVGFKKEKTEKIQCDSSSISMVLHLNSFDRG